jgi:hypothetical protein
MISSAVISAVIAFISIGFAFWQNRKMKLQVHLLHYRLDNPGPHIKSKLDANGMTVGVIVNAKGRA